MMNLDERPARPGGDAPFNRRIILLLDGTWNQDEIGGNSTNIVRLRELIANSLDPLEAAPTAKMSALPASRAETNPRTFEGREYVVFYQRGVGTGPFDRVRGGGFGIGLDTNIRRAYRFLSFHYLPGDEVFIFGFSRGAYTARSLTGYLGSVGLLRCETCTPEREALAWSFYRTPPSDRLPGIWKGLEPHVHPRGMLRIACLGLFDTVGALGVPLEGFRRLNRQNFEFHDVELSSLVDIALHALATDEHRRPFEASLWRRNKFKRTSAIVEQVWFPGVHADIGGGYLNHAGRNGAPDCALDDLSLDWMIKRVCEHFPDFPIARQIWPSLPETAKLGPRHDSRSWTYKLWRKAIRSIGNMSIPPALLTTRDLGVGFDPHARAVNESIHISTLQLLGTQTRIENRTEFYAPPNLVSVLDELEQLYKERPATVAADTLTVTGADGEAVQPQSAHAPRVYAEVTGAIERLERAAPDLARRMRSGASA
ncbi:MAG: DUF2235 domain-containing protein [Alphaproteobacteria bacterium]